MAKNKNPCEIKGERKGFVPSPRKILCRCREKAFVKREKYR